MFILVLSPGAYLVLCLPHNPDLEINESFSLVKNLKTALLYYYVTRKQTLSK